MFKSHSELKYYANGFQLLFEKLHYASQMDSLMDEKDVSLLSLENKLAEVRKLATLERKGIRKEAHLAWGLLTATALTLILSIKISSFYYFLAVPTIIFLSCPYNNFYLGLSFI